ncbi:SH3 domain-containing protein, partial [bacterium]|nr:SH3 domain-containing protein [bacterium]
MGFSKRHWQIVLFEIFLLSLVLLAACGKSDEAPKSQEMDTASAESVVPRTETQPEVFEVVKNENFAREPLKTGYVSAICLNVREASSSSSQVIGHVFKGDPLEVYEVQSGWSRVNDKAGYIDGWVSNRYISDTPVKSDFIIPEDYKGRKTPTINESVSAKYVGVKACIPCHNKPHAGFALGPYGVWRDHFHGSAFTTLATSYSKAIAQRRGINDPTTDWRCVKCHVTALGVSADRKGPNYSDNEGVGCSACHGPGGDYLHQR